MAHNPKCQAFLLVLQLIKTFLPSAIRYPWLDMSLLFSTYIGTKAHPKGPRGPRDGTFCQSRSTYLDLYIAIGADLLVGSKDVPVARIEANSPHHWCACVSITICGICLFVPPPKVSSTPTDPLLAILTPNEMHCTLAS